MRFEVRNTPVQGPSAVPGILRALAELDEDPTVDVVILARGGGSVEDLLPFSDEALCRAISRATTPIVSAIGHEPDSPLSDHVADLRAATPTDAAKLVVPDAVRLLPRAVAERIRTETVAVNGGLYYGPDVPFGGYKHSGIGREMGRAGFEEYTEIKSIATGSA